MHAFVTPRANKTQVFSGQYTVPVFLCARVCTCANAMVIIIIM